MIPLTARQLRRRANARAFRKERRAHARIAGRQPERNEDYKAFIRSFACIVCTRGLITAFQGSRSEAAHTGPHAFGRKASDRSTIPLCGFEHHREGAESYHRLGEKRFQQVHGIDIPKIVADFQELYEERAA